ncbi:unnamed protein product [marine sediment metagenome]|uniref:Uncharacterized protein n=1 Tax=marine sediment metagenome TaxID=412755 RepID=X1UAL5_9ZZZZ
MERAGDVRDIQNVIEAEYHIITEEPSKGNDTGEPGLKLGEGKVGKTALASSETKTQKGSAQPMDEGETFTIDPTWLNESLKELKWSDDTCKTFLVSQYKVSPQGTLEDVIRRLTREQAEEFVKEIQDRTAKKQPGLFE